MRKRIEEWINWVLYDELIASKINAPKHLLGIHDYGEGQIIVVYKPGAIRVEVTSRTGKKIHTMEQMTMKDCSPFILIRRSTMATSTMLSPHMRMAPL